MERYVIPAFEHRHVDQAAIEALAGPVGRIITAWTFIDQNVDLWLRWMQRYAPIDQKKPTNFDDKLKYIRRSTRSMSIHPGAEEVGLDVLRRIKAVAKIRHTLAHWVLTHFSENEETAVFTKLEHDLEDRPGVREMAYTLQFLRNQLDEIILIAGTVQTIVFALSDTDVSPASKIGD